MKPRVFNEIAFSCLLVILLTSVSRPVSSTVHTRCPYTPSTNLLTTSGCRADTEQQSALALSVQLDIGTFSHEHVNGVFTDFLYGIRSLKELVYTEHREWSFAFVDIPRGTYDLNPMLSNTTTLTNTHATNRHRILRELRWWMTAVESGLQLVQSTGQLGVRSGFLLACEASRVSIMLERLLRIFSVGTHSLPNQAGCRQIEPITTDSTTQRVTVTSIILRDTMNAMTRIDHVLSNCEVQSHSLGRHRVRLHCPAHYSLFYAEQQLGNDAYMYHFDHIVNRLRQE